jgi:hypothetical protein
MTRRAQAQQVLPADERAQAVALSVAPTGALAGPLAAGLEVGHRNAPLATAGGAFPCR